MKTIRILRIVGWVSFVVAAAICWVLPRINATWVQKGHANSIIEEDALFEMFQFPWFFFAAAVLWWTSRKVRPQLIGYLHWLIFFILILGFREADLDRQFLGQRWYNLGRYLGSEADLPLINRIMLLAIFGVVVAVIVALVRRHRQVFKPWLELKGLAASHLIGALALVLFAASLAFDKYRTVLKHTGIDLRMTNRVYMEEVFELLGAIMVFIAAMSLAQRALGASDDKLVEPAPWWVHWWPALLGPATFATTYFAYETNWTWFLAKGTHEPIAYGLLAIAIGLFAMRYALGRNPWHLLLMFLGVIFLLREWKTRLVIESIDLNTSAWVFVLLGGWCAWVWMWRNRLVVRARAGLFWPWLCCTGWTYLLSQLMSRRALKFLPMEDILHVAMEESVENTAHIMLIICAFTDLLRRRNNS